MLMDVSGYLGYKHVYVGHNVVTVVEGLYQHN